MKAHKQIAVRNAVLSILTIYLTYLCFLQYTTLKYEMQSVSPGEFAVHP